MKSTISSLWLLLLVSTLQGQESNYHPAQMLVYFTGNYSLQDQIDIADQHEMNIVWISPHSSIHLWEAKNLSDDGGIIGGDINEKVGQVNDPNGGINSFHNWEMFVPGGSDVPNWVIGDPSDPCGGSINTLGSGENNIPDLKIAILDTGVAGSTQNEGNWTFLHPSTFNAFKNSGLGWNLLADNPYPIDDHGHGTHVAGIVAMILASANVTADILHYKTHDSEGKGYASDLIYGLDLAVIAGARVINMSCSYRTSPTLEQKQPLEVSIDAAAGRQALVIASAGNDAINIDTDQYPNFPASFECENVITVASYDCNNAVSWFSNFGMHGVDLAAPGVDIVGPNIFYDPNNTDDFPYYWSKTGTSQATAIVSAVAAQATTYHGVYNYQEIRCAILEGSEHKNIDSYVYTGGVIDVIGAEGILDNGCNNSLSANLGDLDLEQSQQGNEMSLSPNPSSEEFYINLNNDFDLRKSIQVSLMAIDGRRYGLEQLQVTDHQIRLKPANNTPAGLYLVQIRQGQNQHSLRLVWQQ